MMAPFTKVMRAGKLLRVLAVCTLLAACSGGGGGGAPNPGDPGNTGGGTAGGGGGGGTTIGKNGGIGGTGGGTISGFGSVIINDIRRFEVDNDTEVLIDDEVVTESDLKVGMDVRFDIADDADTQLTSGTAVSLRANTRLRGPVTSLNPFQVLRQDVIVTGDTALDDVPGGDIANLNVGDSVDVFGFSDTQNRIAAGRVQLQVGGIAVWKLSGNVSGLLANTSFNIGSQLVQFNGVTPRNCDGGIADGDIVSIRATQDPGFIVGNPLTTVTDIECDANGLQIPDNPVSETIPAQFEGFVLQINSATEFVVNWQRVTSTAATVFEGGSSEDFFAGALVEIEGTLNTATGMVTASKIRFIQARVRIEAPVPSSAVVQGQSLTIMGINAVANALTEDEDGIIASGNAGFQVEVRGFVDANGDVQILRVRERGDSDPTDVRLRGPVSNIVPTTFEILGITIDTATADAIFNELGQAIDSDTFFSLISDGSDVEVEDGTLNGTRIDNAEIEIEDDD